MNLHQLYHKLELHHCCKIKYNTQNYKFSNSLKLKENNETHRLEQNSVLQYMWMTQEVIEVVFAFLGINSNQGAKQGMNYHLKLKVFNSKGVLAQPFLSLSCTC